jgi:UTP--glucose-1-phosphate uridylyltransferase
MLGLARTQPFYGFKFKGKSYDCGSKSGFLAANIAYAMDRDDLRDGLREEMQKYVK